MACGRRKRDGNIDCTGEMAVMNYACSLFLAGVVMLWFPAACSADTVPCAAAQRGTRQSLRARGRANRRVWCAADSAKPAHPPKKRLRKNRKTNTGLSAPPIIISCSTNPKIRSTSSLTVRSAISFARGTAPPRSATGATAISSGIWGGYGHDLSKHFSWGIYGGGGYGKIQNNNRYHPLGISLRVQADFSRISFMAGNGITLASLGPPRIPKRRPVENIKASRPMTEMNIGRRLSDCHRQCEAAVVCLCLINSVRIRDEKKYHLFWISPRIGIETPLTKNNTLNSLLGYNIFTHPRFRIQRLYLRILHPPPLLALHTLEVVPSSLKRKLKVVRLP